MVRLVDEVLRDGRRFGVSDGLASRDVTLADPAVETGTFLLGVLRRIAGMTASDQGPGTVPGSVRFRAKRPPVSNRCTVYDAQLAVLLQIEAGI
jgi:hypothetical protein